MRATVVAAQSRADDDAAVAKKRGVELEQRDGDELLVNHSLSLPCHQMGSFGGRSSTAQNVPEVESVTRASQRQIASSFVIADLSFTM